jgi:hypothetical protein
VLTIDGGVATRRRTGRRERRRLELVAGVNEGTKELRREGMRCGEGRGSYGPFIGAGGALERFGGAGNGSGGIRGWSWAVRGGQR